MFLVHECQSQMKELEAEVKAFLMVTAITKTKILVGHEKIKLKWLDAITHQLLLHTMVAEGM